MTRQIILAGAHGSAADAFAALHRLEELRAGQAIATFDDIDALVLPTAPTIYTVEHVLADPIEPNSRLGTYTNFVNLLDLCGLAVPAAMRADGTPSASRCSRRQAKTRRWPRSAGSFHDATGLPLGA